MFKFKIFKKIEIAFLNLLYFKFIIINSISFFVINVGRIVVFFYDAVSNICKFLYYALMNMLHYICFIIKNQGLIIKKFRNDIY